MRALIVIPLLMLVACGGTEAEQNKAATKAARIAAGQWELTSEVTAFTTVDQGSPQIDTPVGTRSTETVCVAEGRPPTALFAGEGNRCSYDNYYVRNGRLNVTLRCTREGLSGSLLMTTEGRFEEDTLEYVRDLNTLLAGEGDVRISSRVTGRHTGECTAEAADGGNNQSEGE